MLSQLGKQKQFVKMLDFFIFRNHLFIVFEILDISLYDMIQMNNFEGFSLVQISKWIKQIVLGLKKLNDLQIIHCDLKPENILFVDNQYSDLKIIDLGSSCYKNQIIYTYIQSRFYRAPEIILGIPYDCKIDVWSLGCICVELFIGLPIFPGNSQYDQIRKIQNLIDMSNNYGYIKDSDYGLKYFDAISYGDRQGYYDDGQSYCGFAD